MDVDQVKKTIRAILISARNGLSPHQLLKDYETIVGHPLPLKELGFCTLSDAIQAMPDVIRVDIGASYYGRTVLKAVVDQSSAHVASLVSRQRNTKSYSGFTFAPVPLKRKPSAPPSLPPRFLPPPVKKHKEVPVDFSVKMKQLMISYPNGLPLSKFHEAFERRFGYFPNVASWGFSSLNDVFRLVDSVDVVTRKSEGAAPEQILLLATKENLNNGKQT